MRGFILNININPPTTHLLHTTSIPTTCLQPDKESSPTSAKPSPPVPSSSAPAQVPPRLYYDQLANGAGIGLSAKAVEKGGADLIIVYNSGRFRMAGRGSLAGLMPYSDANGVVVDMVLLLPTTHYLSKGDWLMEMDIGQRNPPHRLIPNPRNSRSLRHRSNTNNVPIPHPTQKPRIRRRPKLPNSRINRRAIPPKPRRNRYGF